MYLWATVSRWHVGFGCVVEERDRSESLQRRSDKHGADGLVVLAHGRLHIKSRGPLAEIESRLAFDTFAFDARGMGESDGTTGYSNTEQEVRGLRLVCLGRVDGHSARPLGRCRGVRRLYTMLLGCPVPR